MKKALALILSLVMVLALLPAAATAEGASATLMTELPETGDRVVIHNTTNNKALDACGTNGYYNAGVDITPADGVLTGVSENIIWDVTKNEDGTYRFSQNGKYLSMGASYSSTPYDDVNKDWAIEAHGNGYSIKNVTRGVYLEWYAAKNYFSGYIGIDNSGAFDFQFYKLDGMIVKEPTATPDGSGINLPGTKVTLKCETEGATIYWRIGTEGEFAEYTAPIEINETCTLYAYAKVGEYVSNTVEIPYTVSNSDIMSIPQALAAGDVASAKVVGQLVYRFGNFGSINSAVIQAKIDGEVYALQCYNSMDTDTNEQQINIGDWLVLTGKLGAYGGVQQIQSMTEIRKATPEEIIGEDAIEPQVFENFADINANFNNLLTEYVLIKNVTLGEYKDNGSTTVTDSTGATMPIYRAAPYPVGVEAGDVVNLYACVSKYNTTKQLRNGSPNDYVPTTNKQGPTVTRVTNADAEVGKPYTFSVRVEDANGVASVDMFVNDGVGEVFDTFEDVKPVDGLYTIVIPGEHITGGHLEVEVVAVDAFSPSKTTDMDFEINVVDLPQITGYTPEANSATGENKRPTISVSFANCGENPTVEMKLNDVAVTPVVEGNTATYMPDADMEDGKVVVWVKITRADGKSYETSWSFTVGVATYQLYFGELHSHTAEYSDGTGTLEQALAHAKAADQIDFLAVTDHSNYYDTKDNPNGDMTDASKGKMTTDGSKTLWQEAKATAAQYADDSFIPIIGYEMTWSGQYGHMNTFNSIGFESRNVPKYVVKGGPGLVAYYDRLVEVARIDKENGRKTTINQFNHPGTTFGTFEDFAHYTPAYDELITMIEVGNGEGKVGGSMYWPSYQYYTMALDKGWHLAPTNNQDNHKGGWGDSNTCRDVIYTDNFSEEGIYDAMRNMTMYATEDNDLEIYYTLNDQVMGSVLNLEQGEQLHISVDFKDPTDKVQKVSIIANGDVTVASKTFNAQSGSWKIDLDNNYSYYYIRVDEVDADIAVTAPVWTSETVKVGMSPVEKNTTIELKDEPITFIVPLYNYEEAAIGEEASAVDFTITKVEYMIDDELVETVENPKFSDGTSTLTTTKQDDKLTWVYTPTETGRFTMQVKVTGTFRGVEYVFNGNLGFTVRDGADMSLMLIDAYHSNFYVSGDYADSDTALIELAAQYGVKSQHITEPITDAVLENCDLLVMSVPFKGASLSVADSLYTEDELAAIARYAERGGNFVITSKSDRLEPDAENEWASVISNKLLEAVGAKARVGKGIVSDAVNMTNESYRLHFTGKDFYNWETPLTEYLIENTNLMYSCYNAAPIILNGATSVVKAFDTSFVSSYPLYYNGGKNVTADKIYQPYYDAAGDQDTISIMAYEELPAGGFCVTAGVTFFSTFEVKVELESAATLQNTNYQIVVNLFKMIHPSEVTPIADIHAAGKTNVPYTIEGYVTSNASGYDKDTAFFDCIYIVDNSGRGINVFPVAGRYEIGQKLRITGMTSEYMGEIELNCGNDYGGEIQDITLRDVEYTADGVTTIGYATRARLLDVTITMANMQTIETYVIDDGNLNLVIDGICAENRATLVEPMTPDAEGDFFMEKLTTAEAASPDKVGNLVAFEGTVTKVEYDANGVLGAVHVDDGSGEVVIFLDGYINCSDACEKDAQGYHDLSWVKEGAYLAARGIASIGQNSYEHSDQIGPRIRLRDRADIVPAVKPVVVYGDANGDGHVTAADAALVLRALVGLSTLTEQGARLADVTPDYNGQPTAADAAAILRYVVGLIDTFEVENAH
ncbi:MAG: CehA/McbA family metallohydrolase [Clostridia bacterium]|nr:CehA/McbA family metallohydrolase [Clostridia bacterium]